MKMTLNIDEKLLQRVKKSTGAKTKTEAIHIALGEMDRNARSKAFFAAKALELSPEEWGNAFDPNSVPPGDRLERFVRDEGTAPHARKPRPRR